MPSLGLSLDLGASSSSFTPSYSAPAGFGFPSTISISRSSTSIWNGNSSLDPSPLGLLFGLGAGATRTFTKQTTDLVSDYQGDANNYILFNFPANKYYKFTFTSPYQGDSTMEVPYSEGTIFGYIGLTTNLSVWQSAHGNLGDLSTYGFLNTYSTGDVHQSCPANHWLAVVEGYANFGDGFGTAWTNNSFLATDVNNFPTTGWTSGITIS